MSDRAILASLNFINVLYWLGEIMCFCGHVSLLPSSHHKKTSLQCATGEPVKNWTECVFCLCQTDYIYRTVKQPVVCVYRNSMPTTNSLVFHISCNF